MYYLKSFKKLLSESKQEKLWYLREFIRKFGLRSGLIAFFKIEFTKRGYVKINIPQSKTPFLLRAKSSDLKVFIQIFLGNVYEIPITMNPKFVVDGGANIGLSTIYFANKYPDAKIIAIEPEYSNLALLKENTKSYPNIEVIQAAIWHKKTLITIVDPGDGFWAFQVKESINNENTSKVDTITIDEILELSPEGIIDILKLDIEGAEKEVFTSCESWIDRINIIEIELHERFKPGCNDAVYSAISKSEFTELTEYSSNENAVFLNIARHKAC